MHSSRMRAGGSASDMPPPVNRMTDRCKNITLATTSLRLVKIEISDALQAVIAHSAV